MIDPRGESFVLKQLPHRRVVAGLFSSVFLPWANSPPALIATSADRPGRALPEFPIRCLAFVSLGYSSGDLSGLYGVFLTGFDQN